MKVQALRTAIKLGCAQRAFHKVILKEVAKRCASYANGVVALQVELEQTKERLAQEAAAAKQKCSRYELQQG